MKSCKNVLFALLISTSFAVVEANAQSWPQFGYTASGGRNNPMEKTLNVKM